MIKFGFWKSVCPLFMFCVATVIGSPGQITVLHNFFPGYGADPSTAMVQATDGYFYGTTYTNAFKIDSSGNESTFYSFCTSGANCPDGSDPSGLVQASDGNFYGTKQLASLAAAAGLVVEPSSKSVRGER